MLIRAVVLRVMLGALALAALFGVAAVFVDGLLPAGRLLGTSLTIAIASGMLLPVSATNAARRFSALAVTWTCYVGIGALLVTVAIWHRGPIGMGWGMELPAVAWVGYGLGSILVAVSPLTRWHTGMDRAYRLAESIALWGSASAFALALMLQLSLGTGTGSEFPPAAYFIALGATVVAAICAIGLRSSPSRPRRDEVMPGAGDRTLGAIGIGATAVSALLWLWLAFESIRPFGGEPTEAPWTANQHAAAATAAGTVALCAALWLMLGIFPFKGLSRILRHLTVICTACVGAIVAAEQAGLVWSVWRDFMLSRLLAALVIVDACALLAAVVILRIGKSSGAGSDRMRPVSTARLTCPRCQRPHLATRGESACGECQLVVLLEFRDDVCPGCGYDLRALPEGSSCPECGRLRQVPGSVAVPDA